MLKQYLLIPIVLSLQITGNTQDSTYTNLNISTIAKNANLVYKRNLQFLFDSFAGYDTDGRKPKKDKEVEEILVSDLKKLIRREKYPDSIATGWHKVVITNNKDFYKRVKVFVSKNSVVQLVIEDCIKIPFTAKGQIKNAESVIMLRDINSEFETLNIYFINDLDSIALTSEPSQPGYVCFWTNKGKYLKERLMINSVGRDFITKVHDVEPECIEAGMPLYIMKPGIYKFRATKTGNDREASFEIIPGMCLRYRLN